MTAQVRACAEAHGQFADRWKISRAWPTQDIFTRALRNAGIDPTKYPFPELDPPERAHTWEGEIEEMRRADEVLREAMRNETTRLFAHPLLTTEIDQQVTVI